jgi:integrase
MHIRDKKEVLDNITPRPHERFSKGAIKTYTTFEAYIGISEDGRKIRLGASTVDALKKKIELYYSSARTASVGIFELRPNEVYDAKVALRMLRDRKSDLTLTELARRHLEGADGAVVPKTLGEAFKEYLDGIPDIQVLQRKAVVNRVQRMCKSIGADRLCHEVTAKEMGEYFYAIETDSAKTYNNHASYCKTFFEWCSKKARRYVIENPMSDFNYQKVIHGRPEYMKVEDVEKLFKALQESKRKDLLAVATLSYFCGVRSDEIERLAQTPEDIRIDEGSIIIAKPKGYTQGRGQRVVHIEPNAKEWLRLADTGKMLDGYSGVAYAIRAIDNIADKAGVSLCKNAGRHSYITYHVAHGGDPSKTAANCGTSLKMLRDNYNGLETKANGARYFGIVPVVSSL